MKRLTAAAAVALLAACGEFPATEQSADQEKVAVPPPSWTYNRHIDAVRNAEVATATIRSRDHTTLSFPYGITGLKMTVRRHPEYGLDVIFEASDGQIVCSAYSCPATINFDGEPERLSLGEPSDHNSRIVIARAPQHLVRRLQRARRVIVELTFFQDGARQFTFETAGLRWPPFANKARRRAPPS